jgi:hypothetical protein
LRRDVAAATTEAARVYARPGRAKIKV